MEYHPVVQDDAANGVESKPKVEYPPPTCYPVPIPPVRKNLKHLTADQVKTFDDTGVLVLKSEEVWTPEEKKLLLASVNIMDDWPDAAGKYMKYYEKKRNADCSIAQPEEKILCRIENFTQYNPGLDFILTGPKLLGMTTELFGEPAILYKEKINYKLSGGDGFAPHQDVAAGWWMYGQTLHISCLVCVDEATLENGCLEVSLAEHKNGLLGAPWKEVPLEIVNKLKWEAAPTKPGDVIFFDSFVPHKSAPNFTSRSRRVLYATYSKEGEGDYRERYYADKRISYPPDVERDPTQKYEYKI